MISLSTEKTQTSCSDNRFQKQKHLTELYLAQLLSCSVTELYLAQLYSYPSKQQNFSELITFLHRTQARAVHRRHTENGKQKDNLIKTYLRFTAVKTGEIMFRKTFCSDKRLCFLAGKSDSTMLRGSLPRRLS